MLLIILKLCKSGETPSEFCIAKISKRKTAVSTICVISWPQWAINKTNKLEILPHKNEEFGESDNKTSNTIPNPQRK